MILNLTDMVKGRVHFMFYRHGNLYYKTDNGFSFTVPISDTGTGTFAPEDKAIYFLRWLRPAVKAVNDAVQDVK